jgi:Tol biopolymer transport system component/predicted Ser/Thr protein kinase
MSDPGEPSSNSAKCDGRPPRAGPDGSATGAGGRIGRFRVERELGRGGMGIVYLAHDTTLGRPVAVKSLPPEMMNDAATRSRLEREAKVLASLNHPNVAAIYEELDGPDVGGYLILEYVPGQTLAERIARRRLMPEEALPIALQIAEAVSAAHNKGVIHRDLKPGNIKIDDEGVVKVLDFGIAKAVETNVSSDESTVTLPGHVIGTPAYMSPEQARGKAIDHRCDIWSFGCVLYEMLTGQPAFQGETRSDTLAGVLQAEPDWSRLPKATPANIRVLLRRCLEKDPRRRLHDIADAAIEISETLNQPSIAPPLTASMDFARVPGWKKLMAVGVICLILGVLTGVVFILGRLPAGAQREEAPRSFVIHPQTSLAMEALWHHALAFSPDGKRLAYVEEDRDRRRRIYIKEMDQFRARPLAGTEGAISPFFSPDGQWVGYVDHFQRKLKKVSVKGGEPIILGECLQFRGGTWGGDGSIIFTPVTDTGLWRISESGDGLEQLTVPDANAGEYGHYWPQILPGGKYVLFTDVRAGGLDEYQIELYSLQTGKRHPLFKGGSYARYASSGHLLYSRRETLYAARFDIESLTVEGSGVPVLKDVTTPGSGSAQFAVAGDGSLAYIPVVTRSMELTPVWVDKEGHSRPLAAAPRNYHSVSISPDGMFVAFSIAHGDGSDIWLYDITRKTLNPLTSNGGSSNPVWTPDGKRIIYSSFDNLVCQNADGSGGPERLETIDDFRLPTSCSPDGGKLLVLTSDPEHFKLDHDIWIIQLAGEAKGRAAPFARRNNNQRHAVWSPDGRWVAYSSEESGSWEIYAEPYPGPGPKSLISTQGGIQPVWSRDGKELYYLRGGKVIAAAVETGPQLRVVDSRELFEGRYLSCLSCQTYDVGPDGRFLMVQDPQEPAPAGINVVLNWFEELKRLMQPAKL